METAGGPVISQQEIITRIVAENAKKVTKELEQTLKYAREWLTTGRLKKDWAEPQHVKANDWKLTIDLTDQENSDDYKILNDIVSEFVDIEIRHNWNNIEIIKIVVLQYIKAEQNKKREKIRQVLKPDLVKEKEFDAKKSADKCTNIALGICFTIIIALVIVMIIMMIINNHLVLNY